MSIVVKNLTFTYSPNTSFKKTAVNNISLEIGDNQFVCIIGHTGSGKSTFLQHLNGLIRVQSGSLIIDGVELNNRKLDLKTLRSKVGMVFQYPEHQLFANTVHNDVAFGPRNMKLSGEEVDRRVKHAIARVGLDYDEFAQKSPFELSGGEKRRVAIAGVIAMEPKILVLDEPTSGLDPRGKKEILDMVKSLRQTVSPTVIMISHDMDEVAENADSVIVFNEGEIAYHLPPAELFKKSEELRLLGLDIPVMAQLTGSLKTELNVKRFDVDSVAEAILRKIGEGKKNA